MRRRISSPAQKVRVLQCTAPNCIYENESESFTLQGNYNYWPNRKLYCIRKFMSSIKFYTKHPIAVRLPNNSLL